MCGDASSVGYAAFTPHGEIAYDMAMSFDQWEMDCMQAGALSSVYRETKNARLAVEHVIGSPGPERMAGGMVV